MCVCVCVCVCVWCLPGGGGGLPVVCLPRGTPQNGEPAGGTHPTGMHTRFIRFSRQHWAKSGIYLNQPI